MDAEYNTARGLYKHVLYSCCVESSLPCWVQTAAQVNDVLSPELMQRQEELIPVISHDKQ